MSFHTKSVSSLVRGVVVLVALGAVLTSGTAAAQEESLYDRLGGVYAIAAVADDIVERVLANEIIEANPAVREAHARVSKAGLKYQVASLVCAETGGPCAYVGRDMKTTHADLNISEVEWEALMEDAYLIGPHAADRWWWASPRTSTNRRSNDVFPSISG